MDILTHYQQEEGQYQSPVQGAAQEKFSPTQRGFFIRLAMRLSGGRIKDERSASIVLFAVAIFVFILAGIIFVWGLGGVGGTVPVAPPAAT